MNKDRIGVLFLCMGNICRSPMAEGIFLHLAGRRGVLERFDVDSCGTGGWHAGEPPDPRALAEAARHGVYLPSLARQLEPREDGRRFDLIVAMDAQNREDAIRAGVPEEKIRLMRSFDAAAGEVDVPDPYYGGAEGFGRVYGMLVSACAGLLDHLLGDGAGD
jgi:protein-tyrosine phosphatase